MIGQNLKKTLGGIKTVACAVIKKCGPILIPLLSIGWTLFIFVVLIKINISLANKSIDFTTSILIKTIFGTSDALVTTMASMIIISITIVFYYLNKSLNDAELRTGKPLSIYYHLRSLAVLLIYMGLPMFLAYIGIWRYCFESTYKGLVNEAEARASTVQVSVLQKTIIVNFNGRACIPSGWTNNTSYLSLSAECIQGRLENIDGVPFEERPKFLMLMDPSRDIPRLAAIMSPLPVLLELDPSSNKQVFKFPLLPGCFTTEAEALTQATIKCFPPDYR